MSGWVRIPRETLDEWLWQLPPVQRVVAMTVILRANWRAGSGFSGGHRIDVPRGSLLTSYDSLAARSGVTKKQARTAIRVLTDAGFIGTERARKGLVVSLVNPDTYLPIESAEGTEWGTNGSESGHGEGTQRAPIEEGKKGRSKNSTPPCPPQGGSQPGSVASEVRRAAGEFIEAFNRYFSQARRAKGWTDEIEKALKAGYSVMEMRGAAWGAWMSCEDRDDILANFSPKTILRLKGGRENKTTLPQWLERAEHEWRDREGNTNYPWCEPTLPGVH